MSRVCFPVAVNQILVRDDKVFLIKRSDQVKFLPNTWWLPGGHHDGGETIEQACAREAHEEVGVVIDPKNQRMSCVSHTQVGLESIHFFCVTENFTGEPYNAEPDKVSASGWFDLESLPSPLPDFVRHAIEDSLNKKQLVYHPLRDDL